MFYRYENGDTRLSSTTVISELFILTLMVLVESARLVLGQKHELVRNEIKYVRINSSCFIS